MLICYERDAFIGADLIVREVQVSQRGRYCAEAPNRESAQVIARQIQRIDRAVFQ